MLGNVESLCPVTIVSLLDSNDLQSGGPWNRQWPWRIPAVENFQHMCGGVAIFTPNCHDFNIFCFGMTWHDGILQHELLMHKSLRGCGKVCQSYSLIILSTSMELC